MTDREKKIGDATLEIGLGLHSLGMLIPNKNLAYGTELIERIEKNVLVLLDMLKTGE